MTAAAYRLQESSADSTRASSPPELTHRTAAGHPGSATTADWSLAPTPLLRGVLQGLLRRAPARAADSNPSPAADLPRRRPVHPPRRQPREGCATRGSASAAGARRCPGNPRISQWSRERSRPGWAGRRPGITVPSKHHCSYNLHAAWYTKAWRGSSRKTEPGRGPRANRRSSPYNLYQFANAILPRICVKTCQCLSTIFQIVCLHDVRVRSCRQSLSCTTGVRGKKVANSFGRVGRGRRCDGKAESA